MSWRHAAVGRRAGRIYWEPVHAPNTSAIVVAARPVRWSGRTLGGRWLFTTCARLLPVVGATGARIGSYLIAAGFMATGGRTQYGSLAYWRHLRPHAGVLVHALLVLRHFASFGRILCDRFLATQRPADFTFTHRNPHVLRAAVTSGRGCILLAAHVGNWELSGLRLKKLVRGTLHLVMVRGDDPVLQRAVDERMRGEGVAVIDPLDPLGASLAIHAALGKGETVCMLGDRLIGAQPMASATFLGAPANFPLGPFHTAAITGVPILVCFLVKVGARHYRVEVDDPWFIPLAPRGPARQRVLQAAVETWAARLERQVRRFPLQWHNFYDFWK